MPEIDSIKTFSETQNEFSVQGDRGVSSGPKANQLPKDVIEAMSRGDMELAMLLLKLHQKGEKEEGMVAKFFGLFFRMGTFFFPAAPKAELTVQKREVQRSAPPRTVNVAKVAAHLAFVPVKVFIGTSVAIVKVVHFAFTEIAIPACRMGAHLVRTLYRPLEKRFAKGVHLAEKIYEKIALPLVEKVALKLKEKVDELVEIAKPMKEWLDKKFEEWVARKDVFVQAMGHQMVHVQKLADFTFQISAFAIAPLLLFTRSIKRKLLQIASIKKGLMQVRQFLRRSLAKGLGYFSKAAQAVGFAFLRLAKEMPGLFLRFLRWLYSLLKKLFRFRN